MRLELLPTGLGLLALALGALGLLLGLFLAGRRLQLWTWGGFYLLAGALLLLPAVVPQLPATLFRSPDERVTITVTSDPSGAEVFLGARRVGRTPLELRLPRGVVVAYRVEAGKGVLLPGRFASFSGTLSPQEDGELSVWLDRLE